MAVILQIPHTQYNLYQLFLFPSIHIADFFIFGGLFYSGSKMIHNNAVNPWKAVLFFMFIFNTVGLVSGAVDSLTFFADGEILMYIHPITGVIFCAYLAAFIHQQAEITRRKSALLALVSLSGALIFRLIFLG